MSGTIKGITIEIGGDNTPLQKALSEVDKKKQEYQCRIKRCDQTA